MEGTAEDILIPLYVLTDAELMAMKKCRDKLNKAAPRSERVKPSGRVEIHPLNWKLIPNNFVTEDKNVVHIHISNDQ